MNSDSQDFAENTSQNSVREPGFLTAKDGTKWIMSSPQTSSTPRYEYNTVSAGSKVINSPGQFMELSEAYCART
ncbi:hypothetical protein RRG08_064992 [Elysia crispata]|uniref:Uncharacterized protein n=1 Tax=Elysia crispata TaxID=231223 RepID=A0AAE0Y9R0_9GAST|nr:hypothetical protein RRG08_064992 [Elysia crispata]